MVKKADCVKRQTRFSHKVCFRFLKHGIPQSRTGSGIPESLLAENATHIAAMEIDFSSDGAPEAFFAMGTTGGSRRVTVAGITFELTHQPRLDVLGSQIWSSSILLSEVVATMASPPKFPAMGDVPPAPPRSPSPAYPEPMADSLLVPAPIEISRVLDDTFQSRRKKVIELGAGCTGLSGITMAVSPKSHLSLTLQALAPF